jgi:hypothetical protein
VQVDHAGEAMLFHLLHILLQEASSTKKGTIVKTTPCESCGVEYLYKMSRSAEGNANWLTGGHRQAKIRAEQSLFLKLRLDCDPVPCPSCGWYQKEMIAHAKRTRHRWMRPVAFMLFPIALVTGIGSLAVVIATQIKRPLETGTTLLLCTLSLLSMAAMPLLVFGRTLLSRRYDLNQHALEVQRRRGQARALSAVDFSKRLTEDLLSFHGLNPADAMEVAAQVLQQIRDGGRLTDLWDDAPTVVHEVFQHE